MLERATTPRSNRLVHAYHGNGKPAVKVEQMYQSGTPDTPTVEHAYQKGTPSRVKSNISSAVEN